MQQIKANTTDKQPQSPIKQKNILIMYTPDSTDMEIMRILQENARLTTKEIARKVHLTTTPVYERMRRLENEGFIKRYVAELDAGKLNHGLMVYCNVKLTSINREIAIEFTNIVKEIPEVVECYNISGSFDYMLKIHATDMRHYRDIILNKIGSIPHIGSVESSFVMEEVKHSGIGI